MIEHYRPRMHWQDPTATVATMDGSSPACGQLTLAGARPVARTTRDVRRVTCAKCLRAIERAKANAWRPRGQLGLDL